MIGRGAGDRVNVFAFQYAAKVAVSLHLRLRLNTEQRIFSRRQMSFVQITQSRYFHFGQVGKPFQMLRPHAAQSNMCHSKAVAGGNFTRKTGKHSQAKSGRTGLFYELTAIERVTHRFGEGFYVHKSRKYTRSYYG